VLLRKLDAFVVDEARVLDGVDAGADRVADAGGYAWTEPQARELTYMVRYGMTPLQAIRSATSEAAQALGKAGEVGSIAPGAWGDLVAVRGDPLQDVTLLEKVDGVIKEGRLVR
jgi:imidazolonepropionase-like amidohydrolase